MSPRPQVPPTLYALFDTTRDELPAVVVLNAALRGLTDRDYFPWYLSVIIDAVEVADSGMPTRAEVSLLDALGDAIERDVLALDNAVFVARVTWNATRQLVYYVHDPEVANRVLQQRVNDPSNARPWEFRMERDTAWEGAQPYLEMAEGAGLGAPP